VLRIFKKVSRRRRRCYTQGTSRYMMELEQHY
jgi:hypothetical protein